MNPEIFLQSIYLGDRGCKAILIESHGRRVAIQVDAISRLRPGAKTWDFYTEADIKDGWMVFTGVSEIHFAPSGPLPNDFINNLSVKPLDRVDGKTAYLFELSIGSVDDTGNTTEVTIRIKAGEMHLEDPAKPGLEIL